MRNPVLVLALIAFVVSASGCTQPGGEPVTPQPSSSEVATTTPRPSSPPTSSAGVGDDTKPGNSSGNLTNGGYVLPAGDYLFYAAGLVPADSQIYRVDTRTSQKQAIAKGFFASLNIYGDKLFFSDPDGIVSCSFDGENVTRYTDTQTRFIVHDDAIYYSDQGIYTIDIASGKATKLSDAAAMNLVFAAENMFYLSLDDLDEETVDDLLMGDLPSVGQLYQASKNGTGARKLDEELVWDLNEWDEMLYYLSWDSGRIEKFNPLTSETTQVSQDSYDNINVSGGKIYGSNQDGIFVLDLSGNTLKTYDTDFIGFVLRETDLNVANESIFFHEFASGSLYRIDTDLDTIEVLYAQE